MLRYLAKRLQRHSQSGRVTVVSLSIVVHYNVATNRALSQISSIEALSTGTPLDIPGCESNNRSVAKAKTTFLDLPTEIRQMTSHFAIDH
jgi:hypothetical protein